MNLSFRELKAKTTFTFSLLFTPTVNTKCKTHLLLLSPRITKRTNPEVNELQTIYYIATYKDLIKMS